MSARVTSLVVLCLGLSAAAAQAQAPVAWKLKKGDQFPLSVATAFDEKVTIAGNLIKNKAKTAIGFDVTVRAAPPDGDVVLDLKVMSFQAEGSKSAAAIAKLGKAIKGDTFSVTFDHAMKLKQFEGIDALAKKFAEKESQPKSAPLIEKTLTMLFRYLIEEAFVTLPGKATARGDTWEQTSELDALGLATLETKKVFTDAGPSSVDGKKVRKASIKGVLKLAPPKAGSAAVLPVKARELDLKKQSYKGTLIYDPAAGRPLSIDTHVVTSLTMTLEANQQTFAGEATREQTYQIRFGGKKKAK